MTATKEKLQEKRIIFLKKDSEKKYKPFVRVDTG